MALQIDLNLIYNVACDGSHVHIFFVYFYLLVTCVGVDIYIYYIYIIYL